MDRSTDFSESDITFSPTQILNRIQMLRHLQTLQRNEIIKQQLQYQESPEIASVTEILSHFSDSTSYNTFRTLLQSSQENSDQPLIANKIQRENFRDVIEGITALNLSQESEYINDTPSSTNSVIHSQNNTFQQDESSTNQVKIGKNQITLEEMPILSAKKDFEELVVEKLKQEDTLIGKRNSKQTNKNDDLNEIIKDSNNSKKPYLKRGEGMVRFGINKNHLVIQNIKSLPWRKRGVNYKHANKANVKMSKETVQNDAKVQILLNTEHKESNKCNNNNEMLPKSSLCSISHVKLNSDNEKVNKPLSCLEGFNKCSATKNCKTQSNCSDVNMEGKTWAAVLSNEQYDLLSKLKQSDYYKNFISPTKSTISNLSCNENLSQVKQEKERAEQNLFELLEKKVSCDSFNLENSFFNRFLGKSTLESSGESTPIVFQKCISNNPKLINIETNNPTGHSNISCQVDSCDCVECTENCSSISSCCSCKTITDNDLHKTNGDSKEKKRKNSEKISLDNNNVNVNTQNVCQESKVVNEANNNIEEMNAKLITTSELLKDRLKELEDEIETFRIENTNLSKMREELDHERQKFYEEKQDYEKKFSEEKILSEYYLAEEKEKLQKQKQMYDRYVKDIRGRLSKKEKEEVINFKKEIQDLKEEMRIKDAKYTSTIARLRNQIKIYDKEKKSLSEEVEKLKKDNKRIQHSNDITRRLTNIKYLEQINNKLSKIATKDMQPNINIDPDIKYKAHIIERQSRPKNSQPPTRSLIRPRAKSVPNLKVTSRYAKYFSQKDFYSDMEKNEGYDDNVFPSNNESDTELVIDYADKNENHCRNSILSDEDNSLEKIYNERFRSNSNSTLKSRISGPDRQINTEERTSPVLVNELAYSDYAINKKNNAKVKRMSDSVVAQPLRDKHNLPSNSTKSSIVGDEDLQHTQNVHTENKLHSNIESFNFSKNVNISPVYSNSSSTSLKSVLLNRDFNLDYRMTPSPEPISSTSKSSVLKTNLNPIEITRANGTKELRFPNGNVKIISPDGRYSKFLYYNGDVKENFYNEGKIKYFYAETKTYHTTHADGLEVLEFPDGQIEKRYKDGSSEIRLPNGSVRYFDPKNEYVREEWRFPDGAALTVSSNGEQRIVFPNGQIEVHAKDHKRREFPDGTVKLIYNDGTAETRYSSGRIRIKDKQGNLIMDSAPG